MFGKIFTNTCSVALCVFLLHVVHSAPTHPSVQFSTSCDAPDEAARLRKEENQHLFHPITANNYGVQTFNMTNQILVPTANPPPNSELDCPKGEIPDYFDPQEAKSMCPWVYYENYDPYRIPQRIAMVKCKNCDACLDSNGLPMLKEQMSCHEVIYPMPVLRRDPYGDCIDGMFQYVRELQNVAITCTCQRNVRIQPHGLDNNGN